MLADSTASTSGSTDGCCTGVPCPYAKLRPLVAYLESLTGRADLRVLADLLAGVAVTRADIAPCCVFGQKGYKRNTISSSPWFELLALCWRSGDFTPIHDHQGVSCAFKVVEGTGTEIRFAPTPSGLICPTVSTPMSPGYICAADDADIHQVANMQAPGTDLITLHIYSPPIKSMNTYEFAARVSEESSNKYGPAAAASGDLPC
jgi:cysteine dioxygenase